MQRTMFLVAALSLLGVMAFYQREDVLAEEKDDGQESSDVAAAAETEPKYSPEAEAKAHGLREAIVAEVESLAKHDWAGQYYYGDGLGVNVILAIAPKAGFVFEWHGCMGVYDRNYGPVTEKEGRLFLKLEFPNQREGFQGIADEFIPIAWGERHYLIPADDVLGFCNDINDGTEPRDGGHGSYLLRTGDEGLKVSGPPKLPEEYARYLLDNPIEGEIVEVGEELKVPGIGGWNFIDTRITLKPGKASGLLVGMKLRVVDPKDETSSLTITKVDDESCEAVMTRVPKYDASPQVGWKLSSRPAWRDDLEN